MPDQDPQMAREIRRTAAALGNRLPSTQIPKFRKGRVEILNEDGTIDVVIPPVPDPFDGSGQRYPRMHTLGSYTVRTVGDYVWFGDFGHGSYICFGPENFQPPDEPIPVDGIPISELPDASTIVGTEFVPIVQDGTTVKTTTGALGGGGGDTLWETEIYSSVNYALHPIEAMWGADEREFYVWVDGIASGSQGLYLLGENGASLAGYANLQMFPGDIDIQADGVQIFANDRLRLTGPLELAYEGGFSTLGTVIGRVAIYYEPSGLPAVVRGYIPIYDTIT